MNSRAQPRTAGVGIDLGTANSAVCRVSMEGMRPQWDLARDISGGEEIVSAIFVDTNRQLYHGRGASRRQADGSEADRVLSNIKLLLGQDDPVDLGDQSFRPSQLVRSFVIYLKKCYENSLSDGNPLRRAVITVPAGNAFDADYRAGLMTAIDGTYGEPLFDDPQLLDEPDAALLSMVNLRPLDGQRVLMFDMGGGTLDVCIRQVTAPKGEQPRLEALGLANSDAAGKSVTDELTRFVMEQWSSAAGIDFSPEEQQDILRWNFWASDECKRLLSALATEDEDAYSTARSQACTLHYNGSFHTKVTAADLSRLVEPVRDQAQRTVMDALSDADLKPEQIDSYFMVGGSSNLSLVRRMMADLFEKAPNPSFGEYGQMSLHLAVARGAALHDLRGYVSQSPARKPVTPDEIKESTEHREIARILPTLDRRLPYTVSVIATQEGKEVADAIIRKGASLPTEIHEKQVWIPHPTDVLHLEFVRGEGDPRICHGLRKRVLRFAETREAGTEFTIRVSVDGNGELLVFADEGGLPIRGMIQTREEMAS